MTSSSCTIFDFDSNPDGVVIAEESGNCSDSDSDNESPDLPVMADHQDAAGLITEQLQEPEDVSKLPISAGILLYYS